MFTLGISSKQRRAIAIPKTHNSPASPVFNLRRGLLTLIAQTGLG